MLLAVFGVVLFLFAVSMLVVSVRDRRREAARRPEETRAQLQVLATFVRLAIAIPASIFPIYLVTQGFLWQAMVILVFALLVWLGYAHLVRRSRM